MAFILFDEHLGYQHAVGEVRFNRPKATVRDLIRARVELEIENRHVELEAANGGKLGLGPPNSAEAALNGERGTHGFGWAFLRTGKGIDSLARDAEEAFLAGRYYLLLDDRQAETLEEEIDLERTGNATFLLLTPLQGG